MDGQARHQQLLLPWAVSRQVEGPWSSLGNWLPRARLAMPAHGRCHPVSASRKVPRHTHRWARTWQAIGHVGPVGTLDLMPVPTSGSSCKGKCLLHGDRSWLPCPALGDLPASRGGRDCGQLGAPPKPWLHSEPTCPWAPGTERRAGLQLSHMPGGRAPCSPMEAGDPGAPTQPLSRSLMGWVHHRSSALDSLG